MQDLIPILNRHSTLPVSTGQDVQEYLAILTAAGLDRLVQEPHFLDAELTRITRQSSLVALSEYKTFLKAHDAANDAASASAHLSGLVDACLNTLPNLRESLETLEAQRASQLLAKRSIGLVLKEYPKLIELLELPFLFQTCIKSNVFEEAMEIQAHVCRLLLRYPHLPIIQLIGHQISESTSELLEQFMTLLRGNVKLPVCIRVIGYLKRLEVYGEPELRLMFLQQRQAYLSSLVDSINVQDPFEYLKKYIDLSRENFFEIVTQYRAIFGESQGYTSTVGSMYSLLDPSYSCATQSILSSFVSHFVTLFVKTLEEKTRSIHEVSAIHSILTTTMYFGVSLGRVGVDFRMLVIPIFESAIQRIVQELLDSGLATLLQTIRKSTGVSGTEKTIVGPVLFSIGRSRSSLVKGSSEWAFNGNALEAPSILLNYPALASFYNVAVSGLNQLRLCPVISIREPIIQYVNNVLLQIVREVELLGMTSWDSFSDARRREFEDLCRMLNDVFFVILLKGLEEGVYSGFIASKSIKDRVKLMCGSLQPYIQSSRLRLAQENGPTPVLIQE